MNCNLVAVLLEFLEPFSTIGAGLESLKNRYANTSKYICARTHTHAHTYIYTHTHLSAYYSRHVDDLLALAVTSILKYGRTSGTDFQMSTRNRRTFPNTAVNYHSRMELRPPTARKSHPNFFAHCKRSTKI